MRWALLSLSLLAACIHAPPRASLFVLKHNCAFMRPGMTFPEVVKLFGPAQKNSGAPCLAKSGRCVTWIYSAQNTWGYDMDELAVVFEDSGAGDAERLRVVSWQWL